MFIIRLWFLLALGMLAGCATYNSERSFNRTGDPTVDGPVAISEGPARDKVLWQYRMGAAYMRRGQYAEAKRVLDDALARMGGRFGPDKDAKKARGLFHEEAKKTFLGEPYERVMALYYRGILAWMDGEPDNARACFRSGQVEDSDTENKQYSSDYVLLDYLDGYATTKLGGDGSELLKRARSLSRPGLPDYNVHADVFFFLEIGRGPTKYSTGEYHEQLRFLPGRSEARAVRITVGNQSVVVPAYDDLTYQATTRGGRVMDHILANKAVFKSTTDAVGNVALVGGLAMAASGGKRTQEAGLGLAAFGLVSKLVSAASTPAADIRAWDNLPQYLSFASLSLPPGEHTAQVEFFADGQRPIGYLTKTVRIKVGNPSKDLVIFISDQSSTPQSYETN